MAQLTLRDGSAPAPRRCSTCRGAPPDALATLVGLVRRRLIALVGEADKLGRLVVRPCCRERLAAADAAGPGSCDRFLWEPAMMRAQIGRWMTAVAPALKDLVAMTGLPASAAYAITESVIGEAQHGPGDRRVDEILGDLLAKLILAAPSAATTPDPAGNGVSVADIESAARAAAPRIKRVLARELGPHHVPAAYGDILTRARGVARHGADGRSADDVLDDAVRWIVNVHRGWHVPSAVAARVAGSATPELRADVQQAAAEAMLRAAERYDEGRDVLFSTFAGWPARGRALDLVLAEAARRRRTNALEPDRDADEARGAADAVDEAGVILDALCGSAEELIPRALDGLSPAQLEAVELRLLAWRGGMNPVDALDPDGVGRGAHKAALSDALVRARVNLIDELPVGMRVAVLAAVADRNRSWWKRTREHVSVADLEQELRAGNHPLRSIKAIRRGAVAWHDAEVEAVTRRLLG